MTGGAQRSERPSDILAGRVETLAAVPLFSSFARRELEELAGLFVELTFRTGDTVCREGEEGNTFFVVLSGELEVQGGTGRVINRLGPGEVLGEMSLLMGGRRAATVVVARSARLLALDRDAFERVLLPNAKVLQYFSRLLSQRLLNMARGDAVAKTTTVITVTGRAGLHGRSLVAATLGRLLAHISGREAVLVLAKPARRGRGERSASLVDLSRAAIEDVRGNLEDQGGNVARLPVDADGGQRANAEQLGVLVGKLGERFPFVIFDVGASGDPVPRAADEISDVVVELVERAEVDPGGEIGRGPRRFRVVNLHNTASQPIPVNSCEPFVVPDDPALRDLEPAAQAEHLATHPRSPAAPPLHRLARKILGTSVGIAMGGGAAFGIAHVGVMKVLEDNGIPVDLLAGSSMGSIVALGYAAGITPDEMIEIARRIGTKWTTLSAVVLDFTLTRPALLSGSRLVQIFSPLTGAIRTFDQLTFPCRAVAADIESGDRVWIGSGLLEVAFRASAAVPMLWAPVRLDGRVLVDGGVVDPVPAEVVREMGADICIAVNVVPQLRKGVDTVLSRMYRRVNVLNPLAWLARESGGMPSIFDLVMNTMQALQYELGNFKAISADVRINPDLSAHTWIEFYRALELIERGAEAAERALPEIRRVLADRLRTPARG
jgi:NTE family protein